MPPKAKQLHVRGWSGKEKPIFLDGLIGPRRGGEEKEKKTPNQPTKKKKDDAFPQTSTWKKKTQIKPKILQGMQDMGLK